MKAKKQQYPIGYSIPVKLRGFRACHKVTYTDIEVSIPDFQTIQQMEGGLAIAQALWKAWSVFAHSKGAETSAIRAVWRNLRIDTARWHAQRACGSGNERNAPPD